MPTFKVTYWQHTKYQVFVEAEDAEAAIDQVLDDNTGADEVPGMEETDDYEAEICASETEG